MLQNRSQKPISPQQMFQRLLGQSYRQAQCEDQSQKLKKQRSVLIELIQEYERSIEAQLVKINQFGLLENLKSEKVEELQRLKREREIVEQSVNEEMEKITVTVGEHQEKRRLVIQLQQVRSVNLRLRIKMNDLLQYAQKLQIHNQSLQSESHLVQTKLVNRLRVNSQDWRHGIELQRKRQQVQENEYRTRILQKQTQQIKNVRRQEEQILQRNQERWDSFRKTAFTPGLKAYSNAVSKEEARGFVGRRLPEGSFQRFRVI